MKELSQKLAAIKRTDDSNVMEEARQLISLLHSVNRRWNIAPLTDFLKQKQKELFF